jgi:hypothetical protein
MDNIRGWLAFIMVAGTLSAFGIFPFLASKCEREILLLVVGALGTNLANIIGFYFGSSASSQAKDKTIADQSIRSENALERYQHCKPSGEQTRRTIRRVISE